MVRFLNGPEQNPRMLTMSSRGSSEEEESSAIYIRKPNRRVSSSAILSIMHRRALNALIALLLAVVCGSSWAQQPAPVTQEHWFLIEVGDTPAGWMLERQIRRAGQVTTVSILHLRFRRGTSEQTLEIESRFVETEEGRPLSAWSRQDLGTPPVETSWRFEHGAILAETTHGGETLRQRLPAPPGEWLTPGQLQSRLRQLVASGEASFTLRGVDPQLGLELVETEWLLEARDQEAVIDGRRMRVHRYRQRQSLTPGVETLAEVTSDGLVVRSVTPILGLETTVTLSRRDEVLAKRGAPELLTRSFIYPDRPIRDPRRASRARYEVYVEDGVLASLPSAGSQRVVSTGASRAVIEVGAGPLHEAEDRGDAAEYLRVSTYVDHEDPGVRRLLAAAGVSDQTEAATSRTLRSFVAHYLRDKNLDSVLATAGEVAASRSGDCTEHSVLLTALLRAAGVPARVVTGLVYVDALAGERDLFAYHMWTQALVEGRWVDLDATLDASFDAAHIAFGTTALNDGSATLTELARLATFIGRAKIRVLEVEHRSVVE